MVKKIHSKRSSTRLSILGRPSNSHHPPFFGAFKVKIIDVSIGYPLGLMASVLFGRHHDAILKSQKPKLFINSLLK